MEIRFSIVSWSAWAPGLNSPEAWREWARAPFSPVGEGVPALAEVPAMTRRRLDPLGRMALQTAWQVAAEPPCPVIFASRHGGIGRCFALLEELAAGDGVSPASFSLSVHNAIGALWSIIRDDKRALTATAGGAATVETALCEAAGMLSEGADEVAVVVYDEVVPTVYHHDLDEPVARFAWAMRVSNSQTDCSLSLVPGAGKTVRALPHALEVLRFVMGAVPGLTLEETGQCWEWRRDG